MVAAANPMAVEAGLDVLKRGGSAVDAAIAVQMVLGVVEPQASGIGGGGFLLFYDASSKAITVYDGRETAPAGASPTMFLDREEKLDMHKAEQQLQEMTAERIRGGDAPASATPAEGGQTNKEEDPMESVRRALQQEQQQKK